MDSTSCLPRQVGARPAAPQRQRMLVHCRAHQHAGALPRARRLAQQQRTALEVSGCVCARGRAAPAHSAGRGRPSQYPACQRARDRLDSGIWAGRYNRIRFWVPAIYLHTPRRCRGAASERYIHTLYRCKLQKVTKLQRLQLQTVAHLKPKATHGDTCHMCKRVQQTSMDMHVHMRVRSDHITNALYKKKTLLLARRQTKME